MKYVEINNNVKSAIKNLENQFWINVSSNNNIFYKKNYINEDGITLVKINDTNMKSYEVYGFKGDFAIELVKEIKEKEERDIEYKIDDLACYMLVQQVEAMLDTSEMSSLEKIMDEMSKEYQEIVCDEMEEEEDEEECSKEI